jgi:hypothetical protein
MNFTLGEPMTVAEFERGMARAQQAIRENKGDIKAGLEAFYARLPSAVPEQTGSRSSPRPPDSLDSLR